MIDLAVVPRLAVAALAGLAIGIEREWSGHAGGPRARFAGVRTFLLLGLVGGVGGWLIDEGVAGIGMVLVGAAALLAVVAYAMAARRSPEDIDGTTEAAAILVVGLGAAAGLGWLPVAAGVTAIAALALREKEAIHRVVRKLGENELRGAFQFAVLALVVLPLLPEGPFGPYDAIRPRSIWTVVLLISAVNYAGYVARRAVGTESGYVLAGALGGLISSTAVTLAFARASRAESRHAGALARGAIAASVVLLPRVFVVAAAVTPAFAPRAGMALAPMLLAGLVVMAVAGRGPREPGPGAPAPSGNPLGFGNALRMAVLFQLVLVAIEWVRAGFGELGVILGAAVAGLTDVDALTLGMSRLAQNPGLDVTAARALVVGIGANAMLKSGVAVAFGGPGYGRRVVPGLMAMAAAGVASWWLAGIP